MKFKKSILKFSFFAVVAVVFMLVPRALAAEPTYDMQLSCDAKFQEYKPYQQLVVVDISGMTTNKSLSDADLNKSIYYELAYIFNRKQSIFNAFVINGQVRYQNCADLDISTRSNISDKGSFIVATNTSLPDSFQSVIDTNSLTELKSATLKVENGAVILTDVTKCTDLCGTLKPATKDWKQRDYSVKVDKVAFSEKIGQKDMLDVSVFITNTSKYPLYSDLVSPLVITPRSSPNFYDQSWISNNRVQKIFSTLLPNAQTELKFTLNTPLQVGSYTAKYGFALGDRALAEEFNVAFTVDSNKLKLAIIKPKDNIPFARVRESKSLTSKELFRLDTNTVVIVEKDEGAWLYVSTKDGKKGWMYRPNIKDLN